jgi:hypothetical protein
MLAQDGRRSERLASCALALRRGVGLDLMDQPRDQLPIHLRAEMMSARKLRELDRLFRRIAPGLEVLSPQLGPVLRSPVEPGASNRLTAEHVLDQTDARPVLDPGYQSLP